MQPEFWSSGSLTHCEWYTQWSDIDLAVWDISPTKFYDAVAAVNDFSSEFKVDLVDTKHCRPSVLQGIEEEGVDV